VRIKWLTTILSWKAGTTRTRGKVSWIPISCSWVLTGFWLKGGCMRANRWHAYGMGRLGGGSLGVQDLHAERPQDQTRDLPHFTSRPPPSCRPTPT
jgi:hypothetical protein